MPSAAATRDVATPLQRLRGQDHISALHEWTQAKKLEKPAYEFKQEGPLHSLTYTCTVSVKIPGPRNTGQGIAKKKQVAKRLAAKDLCEKIELF